MAVTDTSGIVPADCRQLLLCLGADWENSSDTAGMLYRFERLHADSAWQPSGTPCPVQLGRGGMGWGLGLHTPATLPADTLNAPQKTEGDGRTPAGIFRIGEAFGIASPETARQRTRLPYRQSSPTLLYVDDAASRHYNRPVNTATLNTPPDWQSAETLLREDHRYDWVIVIEHNHATASHPAQAGGGSCIFIHLWQDAQTPTAGCTALCRTEMENLLGWLDPARQPCVVQLPAAVYNKLGQVWGLPAINNTKG